MCAPGNVFSHQRGTPESSLAGSSILQVTIASLEVSTAHANFGTQGAANVSRLSAATMMRSLMPASTAQATSQQQRVLMVSQESIMFSQVPASPCYRGTRTRFRRSHSILKEIRSSLQVVTRPADCGQSTQVTRLRSQRVTRMKSSLAPSIMRETPSSLGPKITLAAFGKTNTRSRVSRNRSHSKSDQ